VTVNERARILLAKIARITVLDTQAIRERLLRQLEGLFELAMAIAKGNMKRLR
jgi:hypothetical protein